jgi:hypothetical protein
LTKAVALRPDFFGSNALLGATLYALGQDEPAYKVLSHTHALNPEDRDTASLLFKEALFLANREESQKKYDSLLMSRKPRCYSLGTRTSGSGSPSCLGASGAARDSSRQRRGRPRCRSPLG